MNNLSRALAVALLAATVPATIVVAQQGEKPAAENSAELRDGASKDVLSRMQDGRIAMAKAALRLTPEQEKLWAPVEEKIRANFEERAKKRQAWTEKREQRRAEKREDREERRADDGDRDDRGDRGDRKRERLALPDRLEKRSDRMTKRAEMLNERAAKTKEFAAVLKPLYDSFNDEQKLVAGKVIGHLAFGGGKGHHGKWAMGGGKRHHHDRD
jgi:hypothetical protein